MSVAPRVWHRKGVLRLAGARLLDDRDRAGVRAVLDCDPVAACMVAARVEVAGLDPWRLGGQLWAFGSRMDGLCFAGANLVPLRGERAALRAFADRARRHGRNCSSLVGRAELVLPLWDDLVDHWAPAREVRADQPLMVLAGRPAVTPDPFVRPVQPAELERYLPAAIAMFTEEVGIDPRARRRRGRLPGPGVRARLGRSCLRPLRERRGRVQGRDRGDLGRGSGQIQGVWVHPAYRGRGYGTAGTAAVTERLAGMGRLSSLYVNAFNHVARTSYARVGFRQVGSFATILF